MLIVTWYDNINHSVNEAIVQSLPALNSLVSMLENAKMQFFVSDRDGKMSQKMFFKTGFQYWLEPSQTFSLD